MKAYLEFHKAVLFLERGHWAKGKEALERAIAQAEYENDEITLVQAWVCLGDLLIAQGNAPQANLFLNKALAYKNKHDALTYECNRAAELLLLTT